MILVAPSMMLVAPALTGLHGINRYVSTKCIFARGCGVCVTDRGDTGGSQHDRGTGAGQSHTGSIGMYDVGVVACMNACLAVGVVVPRGGGVT